jgi:hypothetical protein
MNIEAIEAIEAELKTKGTRRDELQSKYTAAKLAVEGALGKFIGGTATAATLTQCREFRDTLKSAITQLEGQIEAPEEERQPLSAEASLAEQWARLEVAAKAYEVAAKAYDEATLKFDNALRSFMANHKTQALAVSETASEVRQAENALKKLGQRPHYQAGTVECPRPHGLDVRGILATLQDYLEKKKCVSIDSRPQAMPQSCRAIHDRETAKGSERIRQSNWQRAKS